MIGRGGSVGASGFRDTERASRARVADSTGGPHRSDHAERRRWLVIEARYYARRLVGALAALIGDWFGVGR
jgi:hypothetical protein